MAITTQDQITDYHKAVVGVYSDILSGEVGFPSHQKDKYNNDGNFNIEPNIKHEGRITVDLTNKDDPKIQSLIYVNSNGVQVISQ